MNYCSLDYLGKLSCLPLIMMLIDVMVLIVLFYLVSRVDCEELLISKTNSIMLDSRNNKIFHFYLEATIVVSITKNGSIDTF